jgi:hypothetical protein
LRRIIFRFTDNPVYIRGSPEESCGSVVALPALAVEETSVERDGQEAGGEEEETEASEVKGR